MPKVIKPQTFKSKVGVHHGGALTIFAGQYPTLTQVLYEIVQNIIDGVGKGAEIYVNLQRGTIAASDNGKGCSRSEFAQFISELCKTQKEKSIRITGRRFHRPLGQFGIGIVAPIGKCREYYFEACPRADKSQAGWEGYTRYDMLAPMRDQGDVIPGTELIDLNKKPEWWNTRSILKGISRDRAICNLDYHHFMDGAAEQFGEAIRNVGITIKVTWIDQKDHKFEGIIEPIEFRGREIEKRIFRGKDCGQVKLHLFLCENPTPADRGIMVITGYSDFRLKWSHLVPLARKFMDDEVLEILSSRNLQGQIMAERCKIEPRRTSLQEDDALVDFLAILEQWAKQTGRDFLTELGENQKSDRRLLICRQVCNIIDQLCRLDPTLMDRLVAQFTSGVTDGHVPVNGKTEVTAVSGTATSKQQPVVKPDPEEKPDPKDDPREKTGRTHTAVIATRGRKRVIARGQSGLPVEIREDFGGHLRWRIDERAVIVINSMHKDFQDCEAASEAQFREYLLQCLCCAMAEQEVPDASRHHAHLATETYLSLQVRLIQERTALVKRARAVLPIDHERSTN